MRPALLSVVALLAVMGPVRAQDLAISVSGVDDGNLVSREVVR